MSWSCVRDPLSWQLRVGNWSLGFDSPAYWRLIAAPPENWGWWWHADLATPGDETVVLRLLGVELRWWHLRRGRVAWWRWGWPGGGGA